MRVDGSFPEWLPKPTYLHSVPGEPKEPGNPTQKMTEARDFFRGFGLPIAPNGLVDATALHPEHIDRLRKWREVVSGNMGVEMPTEDEFYRKTLLAVSLWPQKDGDAINYLIGKGAGVEVALRGNVQGRIKRPFIFPYRQHSDFELYDVKYNAGPSGENLDNTRIYPEAFVEVFGGQEYFPPTKTKGLRGLPFDQSKKLLDQTYETVDLGGIPVLIPQLELLFLDKYQAQESTPRQVDGKIMIDAKLLARQYQLNTDLVHEYLMSYIIPYEKEDILKYFAYKIEKPLKSFAEHSASYYLTYFPWMKEACTTLTEKIEDESVTVEDFQNLLNAMDVFWSEGYQKKPYYKDDDQQTHPAERLNAEKHIRNIERRIREELLSEQQKIDASPDEIKAVLEGNISTEKQQE